MTAFTDLDLIDRRFLGLGKLAIQEMRDAGTGSATDYFDVPSGQWRFTGSNPQGETQSGLALLLATLFVRGGAVDKDIYDTLILTVNRGLLNQQVANGFFSHAPYPTLDAGSELATGHTLTFWAATIDVIRPYLPTWMLNRWMAAYKRAVDRIWTVDGNGAGSGLFWVNGNYNQTFESSARWYGLRANDAAYITQADQWWTFLLNGTRSGAITTTQDGSNVATIPGWPTTGPTNGNASFARYGLWFSTPPTTTDWSDGSGVLAETIGTIAPTTIQQVRDYGYGIYQLSLALQAWRTMGDIRYKRLANVLWAEMLPRINLTNGLTWQSDNGNAVADVPVTNADAGAGGVVRLHFAAGPIIETPPVNNGAGSNPGIIKITGVPGGVTGATINSEYLVQNPTATSVELAGTTFGGAYTSGGSFRNGRAYNPWGINTHNGSRGSQSSVLIIPVMLALSAFGTRNYDTTNYLIPNLTVQEPGIGRAFVSGDGAIESQIILYVRDAGGGPGGVLQLGLTIAETILWLGLLRSGWARGRPS